MGVVYGKLLYLIPHRDFAQDRDQAPAGPTFADVEVLESELQAAQQETEAHKQRAKQFAAAYRRLASDVLADARESHDAECWRLRTQVNVITNRLAATEQACVQANLQVQQAVAGRRTSEAQVAGMRMLLGMQQAMHAAGIRKQQQAHAHIVEELQLKLEELQGQYDSLSAFWQASQVQACRTQQQRDQARAVAESLQIEIKELQGSHESLSAFLQAGQVQASRTLQQRDEARALAESLRTEAEAAIRSAEQEAAAASECERLSAELAAMQRAAKERQAAALDHALLQQELSHMMRQHEEEVRRLRAENERMGQRLAIIGGY